MKQPQNYIDFHKLQLEELPKPLPKGWQQLGPYYKYQDNFYTFDEMPIDQQQFPSTVVSRFNNNELNVEQFIELFALSDDKTRGQIKYELKKSLIWQEILDQDNFTKRSILLNQDIRQFLQFIRDSRNKQNPKIIEEEKNCQLKSESNKKSPQYAQQLSISTIDSECQSSSIGGQLFNQKDSTKQSHISCQKSIKNNSQEANGQQNNILGSDNDNQETNRQQPQDQTKNKCVNQLDLKNNEIQYLEKQKDDENSHSSTQQLVNSQNRQNDQQKIMVLKTSIRSKSKDIEQKKQQEIEINKSINTIKLNNPITSSKRIAVVDQSQGNKIQILEVPGRQKEETKDKTKQQQYHKIIIRKPLLLLQQMGNKKENKQKMIIQYYSQNQQGYEKYFKMSQCSNYKSLINEAFQRIYHMKTEFQNDQLPIVQGQPIRFSSKLILHNLPFGEAVDTKQSDAQNCCCKNVLQLFFPELLQTYENYKISQQQQEQIIESNVDIQEEETNSNSEYGKKEQDSAILLNNQQIEKPKEPQQQQQIVNQQQNELVTLWERSKENDKINSEEDVTQQQLDDLNKLLVIQKMKNIIQKQSQEEENLKQNHNIIVEDYEPNSIDNDNQDIKQRIAQPSYPQLLPNKMGKVVSNLENVQLQKKPEVDDEKQIEVKQQVQNDEQINQKTIENSKQQDQFMPINWPTTQALLPNNASDVQVSNQVINNNSIEQEQKLISQNQKELINPEPDLLGDAFRSIEKSYENIFNIYGDCDGKEDQGNNIFNENSFFQQQNFDQQILFDVNSNQDNQNVLKDFMDFVNKHNQQKDNDNLEQNNNYLDKLTIQQQQYTNQQQNSNESDDVLLDEESTNKNKQILNQQIRQAKPIETKKNNQGNQFADNKNKFFNNQSKSQQYKYEQPNQYKNQNLSIFKNQYDRNNNSSSNSSNNNSNTNNQGNNSNINNHINNGKITNYSNNSNNMNDNNKQQWSLSQPLQNNQQHQGNNDKKIDKKYQFQDQDRIPLINGSQQQQNQKNFNCHSNNGLNQKDYDELNEILKQIKELIPSIKIKICQQSIQNDLELVIGIEKTKLLLEALNKLIEKTLKVQIQKRPIFKSLDSQKQLPLFSAEIKLQLNEKKDFQCFFRHLELIQARLGVLIIFIEQFSRYILNNQSIQNPPTFDDLIYFLTKKCQMQQDYINIFGIDQLKQQTMRNDLHKDQQQQKSGQMNSNINNFSNTPGIQSSSSNSYQKSNGGHIPNNNESDSSQKYQQEKKSDNYNSYGFDIEKGSNGQSSSNQDQHSSQLSNNQFFYEQHQQRYKIQQQQQYQQNRQGSLKKQAPKDMFSYKIKKKLKNKSQLNRNFHQDEEVEQRSKQFFQSKCQSNSQQDFTNLNRESYNNNNYRNKSAKGCYQGDELDFDDKFIKKYKSEKKSNYHIQNYGQSQQQQQQNYQNNNQLMQSTKLCTKILQSIQNADLKSVQINQTIQRLENQKKTNNSDLDYQQQNKSDNQGQYRKERNRINFQQQIKLGIKHEPNDSNGETRQKNFFQNYNSNNKSSNFILIDDDD